MGARVQLADTSGWSLTEAGRTEDERRLCAELEEHGARSVVADVHDRFLPLNARFLTAVTPWQTRPMPGNAMAANDHTDFRWDERVIDTLASLGRRMASLNTELAGVVDRFDGYARRYDAALTRVIHGDPHWVDGIAVDSCHLVWMQLHEDLIATLGLSRGHPDWNGPSHRSPRPAAGGVTVPGVPGRSAVGG